MVMAVETLALVVAVVTADSNGDGNGNGGWNRVSGGSGGGSGKGGGRQQQILRGQATINKMRQAELVVADTATMAAAIIAAWVHWQAGVAAWRKPWCKMTERGIIEREGWSDDQRWWCGTFLCLQFTNIK
jgi:hypothetical protein